MVGCRPRARVEATDSLECMAAPRARPAPSPQRGEGVTIERLVPPHPTPCKSAGRDSRSMRAAVAGGSPMYPGSLKTVGERGPPPVNPSNPNSRRGRKARSPIRQGRVAMESITVGIDVSKDRLDVAVRPSGEAFAVERNAAGLEQLTIRLRELAPQVIA